LYAFGNYKTLIKRINYFYRFERYFIPFADGHVYLLHIIEKLNKENTTTERETARAKVREDI
jgi:phage-related protein